MIEEQWQAACEVLVKAAKAGPDETVLMNSTIELKKLTDGDQVAYDSLYAVLVGQRGIHLWHQQVADAERQNTGAAQEAYRSDLLNKCRNILVTTFDGFARGLSGQDDLAQNVGGLGKRLQAHSLLDGEPDRAIKGCLAQIDANRKTLDDAAAYRMKVDNFLAAFRAL
jgi:hypothetical protein